MTILYRKIAEVKATEDAQIAAFIDNDPDSTGLVMLAEALRSRSDSVSPLILECPIEEGDTEVLLGDEGGYYILSFTPGSHAALIEIIED